MLDIPVHAVVGALDDAIAQDREAVGQAANLLEPVADVDDGAARVADLADERLQPLGGRDVEDRGRLVEQQDLGLVNHRAHDLEHLAATRAEVAHAVAATEGEIEAAQQRAADPWERPPRGSGRTT